MCVHLESQNFLWMLTAVYNTSHYPSPLMSNALSISLNNLGLQLLPICSKLARTIHVYLWLGACSKDLFICPISIWCAPNLSCITFPDAEVTMESQKISHGCGNVKHFTQSSGKKEEFLLGKCYSGHVEGKNRLTVHLCKDWKFTGLGLGTPNKISHRYSEHLITP